MPGAARGNGADSVLSATGTGDSCAFPMTTATDKCSSNVLANGIGIVRAGDQVAPHPAAGCGPDNSTLTSFSSTVFINGSGAGRVGDQYTSDNIITSGSGNVLIGG
jgi:uncharacterized Zn-binding protein involved in type VI secretion